MHSNLYILRGILYSIDRVCRQTDLIMLIGVCTIIYIFTQKIKFTNVCCSANAVKTFSPEFIFRCKSVYTTVKAFVLQCI